MDVLSNMSYLVVPLLDDELVEASDGISAGIAAITTLLTGQTGGYLTAIG